MKRQKVLEHLERSVGISRILRVERDVYDGEHTEGYALALTDEWVAIHVLADGVHLDGVVLMRLRDISRVRDVHSDYLDRALASLDAPPAVFDCPSDATTREFVLIVAALHPLSAFALGDEGAEQLMIGTLLKEGKRRAHHRYIHPDGTWDDEIDRWKYGHIASIRIGGRYIDALATLGDPRPDDAGVTETADPASMAPSN